MIFNFSTLKEGLIDATTHFESANFTGKSANFRNEELMN